MTGKKIPEEAVQKAVANSRKAAVNYQKQLALRKDHDPVTSLTNELYAIFMCHLLAGSEASVKYTELLLEDVKKAPKGEGLACPLDAYYAIFAGAGKRSLQLQSIQCTSVPVILSQTDFR